MNNIILVAYWTGFFITWQVAAYSVAWYLWNGRSPSLRWFLMVASYVILWPLAWFETYTTYYSNEPPGGLLSIWLRGSETSEDPDGR